MILFRIGCIVKVGADGLETKVPISLDEDEIKALQESARTLKEVVDTIDFN